MITVKDEKQNQMQMGNRKILFTKAMCSLPNHKRNHSDILTADFEYIACGRLSL